jgi:hypothetical protein
MALPLVPSVVQLSLIATLDGEEYNSIWYAQIPFPPDITDLPTMALNFATEWSQNIAPQQSLNFVLSGARARYIGDASYPEASYALPTVVLGSKSGAGLPNNVAFCVSKQAGPLPAVKRGKVFHGGLTQTQLDTANVLTLVAATAIVDAYDSLVTDFNAYFDVGATMVVLSNYVNGGPASAVVVAPITGIFARDRNVDSQRRRLRGRGN